MSNSYEMIKPGERQQAMVFARIFSVLSDPNRLLILKEIGKKEISVNQLAIALNLSQPLVSHHLTILKSSGLVKASQQGSFVFYSLTSEKISDLMDGLIEVFEEINQNTEFTPSPQVFFFRRRRRGRGWM